MAASQGAPTTMTTLQDLAPETLLSRLALSGLRGRGGGWFPAARKWQAVVAEAGRPVVIANGAEGEPGSHKDRFVMLKRPDAVVEGLRLAARAVSAREAIVFLKASFDAPAQALASALASAQERSALDGLRVTVRRGDDGYITGEETALLESLEGKRGQPRSKPPFPAISGLYASPTLINNVETITTVPKVLELGAEEYSKLGSPPDSTGTRVFCLSGNVERPGPYELPHGITVRHLVYDIGGGIPDGRELKAVMVGGSSFPVMSPDEIDTKLDANSLAEHDLFIGSGVITAIDDRACIVQFALRVAQFYMHESCGKCTPCRVGTRWLVQLLLAVENGTASERDLELLLDVCDRIIGKCLCVLGDSAAMPVASCVTKFRDEFRAHLEHGGCPFGADSSLHSLFAPVDQHTHTAVPAEAPV